MRGASSRHERCPLRRQGPVAGPERAQGLSAAARQESPTASPRLPGFPDQRHNHNSLFAAHHLPGIVFLQLAAQNQPAIPSSWFLVPRSSLLALRSLPEVSPGQRRLHDIGCVHAPLGPARTTRQNSPVESPGFIGPAASLSQPTQGPPAHANRVVLFDQHDLALRPKVSDLPGEVDAARQAADVIVALFQERNLPT